MSACGQRVALVRAQVGFRTGRRACPAARGPQFRREQEILADGEAPRSYLNGRCIARNATNQIVEFLELDL